MPDPTAIYHTDAGRRAEADDTAPGGPAPAAGGFAFPPPDRPGDLGRLGRYRVLKELGRGGMGAVFLGHDDQLGRRVAVKVMLPRYAADPVARQRFLREARTAAAVKSEHVIDIYDVDEAGGLVYIAMRFLDGCPLDEYLRRKGRLTVPQVLRVGRETADGLAAAHATRLIHRDIKPANLWLEAPNGRVVVLDFGLAKPVADGGAELTNSGALVGTPGYMAPEQARGTDLDGRADLFSLGCVLYRLATGYPPFPGPNVMAVLAAVLSDTPRPVWELAPDVPRPLADLIHRLLAKNPDDRPPTARDVSAALAAVEFGLARGEVSAADPVPVSDAADTPIPVEPNPEFGFDLGPPADTPAPPPRRRSRALPASLAGAAVVLAAAGVAAWVATRSGPAPPTEAPERPPPTTRPTVPKKTDRDRELARWVLARRGYVYLDGHPVAVIKEDAFPAGPFRVTGVGMWHADPVSDHDLDRLASDALTMLDLRGPAVSDDGLKKLAGFGFAPKLTRLSLITPRVTDAGAASLDRFPKVTGLWFHNNPNLTDDGLAFLAKMPDLAHLDLTGCTGITGDGLRHARTGNITRAVFDQCKTFDDAGPARLAGWSELTDLNLTGTAVTDDGVVELAAAPKLAELHLSATGVTDAAVESLSVRPLTSLQLSATGVTDTGVRAAARMPRLKHLNLDGAAAVTDAGLAALCDCKTLRILNLTDTRVTLAGVRAFKTANPACAVATRLYHAPDRKAAEWVLARGGWVLADGNVVKPGQNLPAGGFALQTAIVEILPEGTTLNDLDVFQDCDRLTTQVQLGGPAITDAAVKKLAGFPFAPKLQTLVFNSSRVTDDGLAAVAGFPELESLFLRGGTITGAGLGVCRKLPKLAGLYVNNHPVADAGVKHLRGLGLIKLDLSYTQVTDAAAADIGSLARLKTLYLTGTGVSDAGLKPLAGCRELATLLLGGCPGVTDAGLGVLAGFPTLTVLNVQRTTVTAAGVKAFSLAVPGCKVIWDGGEIAPTTVMQRAAPVLHAVVKLGGTVQVVSPGWKPTEATEFTALPPDARVTTIRFLETKLDLPGVDPITGAGHGEAIAAVLRDLPPGVWDEGGELNIGYRAPVTPAGWAALAAVPGARAVPQLRFTSLPGTNDLIPHLPKFPRLRTLWVNFGDRPTADHMAALAALPALRRLSIYGGSATDLTADHLAPLRQSRLTALAIGDAPKLTDAAVPAFAAIPDLTVLSLGPTGMTADGVKKLAAAMPGCEIHSTHGKYMPRGK